MTKQFSWTEDSFDSTGKIKLLYRLERPLIEGLIHKGDTVLDIGGWGKLSYRLYQEGCNITLLSNDTDLCNNLSKSYPNTFKIVNRDARSTEFPDNHFDVVTCYETIEHIIDNREKLIKEIFRVLKSNGLFIGTVPIPDKCHPLNDNTIKFCYPEDLKNLTSPYISNIHIEPTPSITINDKECASWYFYAKKKED